MTDVTRKEFLRACAGYLWMPALGVPADRFEPSYLALLRSGELRRRADALRGLMRECRMCPRECAARRLDNETGFCGAGRDVEVASVGPHFGEERGLVGRGGSGTIFLTHCNLRCVFCQNWEISQRDHGERVTPGDMAGMMLRLQGRGCHNINFVTPTHYTALIVQAIEEAAARGLRLPVVWNTSGWERLETLRLLDGIVDIYMPDFKYADPAMADRYSSGARTYPELTRAALLDMQRQVGVAHPASDGIIRRGLIIRHLVMPNNVGGTEQVIGWIAANLPKDTYLNLMSQYRPAFRAFEHPAIARRVERREYDRAVQVAIQAGLTNLDVQGGLR
ncbi:MAG TPA: radical SAM protein [Vicinamibacterales bacterium]|nr:radical SAM protein [Vicinamibacterales bacterium]